MTHEFIGLLPAGGNATRIAPLPCSKEIYPVGMQVSRHAEKPCPKVAAHYLLEKMMLAGAQKAYVILRKGKWDIPAYFGDGKLVGVPMAYLIMDASYGVPYTLDQAYPYVKDAIIFFGFPDIVFCPDNAFVRLYAKLRSTNSDIVLGLFQADNPHKMDMVDMDQAGEISDIQIKPSKTNLKYTWIIASWKPSFSQFMHQYLSKDIKNRSIRAADRVSHTQTELFVGDVIKEAIHHNIKMDSVIFSDGGYLDIGTPEDIVKITDNKYGLLWGDRYDHC